MRSTFSLLGTIKCSTCGIDVDIAELGDHVCAPQKGQGLISTKGEGRILTPNRRGAYSAAEETSSCTPGLITAGQARATSD